jgi:hypothetical protein
VLDRDLERAKEDAMASEWPMFILQSIAVIALVGALFIRT